MNLESDLKAVGPRIRMMMPHLTPLEARVVETVFALRTFDDDTSLKEIASEAGVSEAMVVKITKKLGFAVRTDATLDGFRWLTVGPPNQRDLELVLMKLAPGGPWSDETVAQLQALLGQGGLGGGVFEADDCRRTYEELRGRGVEFTSPPTERPYGVEATFKDPFGNWFSMTQPR